MFGWKVKEMQNGDCVAVYLLQGICSNSESLKSQLRQIIRSEKWNNKTEIKSIVVCKVLVNPIIVAPLSVVSLTHSSRSKAGLEQVARKC